VRVHDRRGDAEEPQDEAHEVDLHGLRPDEALRRVAQEIHACRVKLRESLKIITGKGWGNLRQQPILRPKVERWLQGPDGRRLGVVSFDVADDGGSLIVHLRSEGHRGREISKEDGA
jgi:DNA-nicking Smr family endonuclease